MGKVIKTAEEAVKEADEIVQKSKTVEGLKEVIKSGYVGDPAQNPEGGLNSALALMGDEDSAKKMIEAINKNPSYSDDEKKRQIAMIEEMQPQNQTKIAEDRKRDVELYHKLRGDIDKQKVESKNNLAKSTLKSLSVACEVYAKNHQGTYPSSVEELMNANPPYLTINYCQPQENVGFVYKCEFNTDGYVITATPVKMGETGSAIFTVKTGGRFFQQ